MSVEIPDRRYMMAVGYARMASFLLIAGFSSMLTLVVLLPFMGLSPTWVAGISIPFCFLSGSVLLAYRAGTICGEPFQDYTESHLQQARRLGYKR